MNIYKSIILNLVLYFFVSALFFFTCTTPDSPISPANSKSDLNLISSDGVESKESIEDSAGDTINVDISVTLPQFIDSINLVVLNIDSSIVDSSLTLIPVESTSEYDLKFSFENPGNYFITVLTWRGSEYDSAGAEITIHGKPAIINIQPGDTTFNISENAFLYVKVSGTEPIIYQWYKELTLVSDTSGDTLNFSSVQPADSGMYRCIIFNKYGDPDTSKYARLSVYGEPNQSPVIHFIGDSTGKEMKSMSLSVNFFDPDSDAVTFTHSELPEGAVYDTAQHTFQWTPTYDQAGTYTFVFSVRDTIFTTTDSVRIEIADSNRAPFFVNFPENPDSAELGRWITRTLTVSDSDTDDNPVIFLKDGLFEVTVDTSTNSFTFRANREKFLVGMSDSIVIGLTDNKDTAYATRDVIITPHQWTFVHTFENAALIRSIAAFDSSVIIVTRQDSTFNYLQKTENGGAFWSNIKPQWEHYFGTIDHMKFIDKNNFITVENFYGNINIFKNEFATGNQEQLGHFAGGAGFGISLDASIIAVSHWSCTMCEFPTRQFYYSDGTFDSSYVCDFTFKELAFSEGSTLFGLSDSGLFRMTSFVEDSLINYGWKYMTQATSSSNLATDRNDGDTLYFVSGTNSLSIIPNALDNTSHWIRGVTTGLQISKLFMLNGSIGWAVTTTGDLYFTNDAFVNVRHDGIVPPLDVTEENPTIVQQIIVAEDGETIFIVTEKSIYRY